MSVFFFFFFFTDTSPPEIYTLSLHDALPISTARSIPAGDPRCPHGRPAGSAPWMRWFRSTEVTQRSEEHTSELQSLRHLVCRLLLEKKKNKTYNIKDSHINTTHIRTQRSTKA